MNEWMNLQGVVRVPLYSIWIVYVPRETQRNWSFKWPFTNQDALAIRIEFIAEGLSYYKVFLSDIIFLTPFFTFVKFFKKNIEESSASLVQTLILLSKEDRKYISSELATSLIVSERMRSDLQDAAKEFINAEGYDKQFKVFQRYVFT